MTDLEQRVPIRTPKYPAPWRDPLGALWRLLQRPWLLITLGLCALLLILCALFLPQLPAEISDNPAAISRWLTEQSSRLPVGGNILRALGLFDVLHSALLRLLLTLIGLTLLIHFADLVAIALHHYRLPKQITKSLKADSVTFPLASPTSTYRQSTNVAESADIQSEKVQTYLNQQFGNVVTLNSDTENGAKSGIENATNFLARRNLNFALLRPLLILGLLLSLVPVWNIIINGWELSPPPLAPGEFQRYESNQLSFRYDVATGDETEDGAESNEMNLQIQVGEDEQIFPVDGSIRTTINQVEIRAAAGPPALRVSTVDGQERLALQGQSAASSSVGLTFSEPGNEGIILIPSTIPEQAAILRIVRGPELDEPNYLIEVLSPNTDATTQTEVEKSIRMRPNEVQNLEIMAGQVPLRIDSTVGLSINARYLPTTWLFIPAVILVLLGALGYWRPPAFLFAQIVARGADQSTTILQSDSNTALKTAVESATQNS